MKVFPVALLGVLLVAGGLTSRSSGQDQPLPHSTVRPHISRVPSAQRDPLDITAAAPETERPNDTAQEVAKLRSEERRKKVAADTEKLVELARDLSAQMKQSNADTLSADQIKKLDTIEKLARGVKARMKS